MNSENTSRRAFLTRLGLGAVSIGAIAAVQACGKSGGAGGEAPKCDDMTGVDDAAKATRTSLKYVDKSVEAGKSCKVCMQYIAPEGGAACGGCKLFKGPVSADGYCAGFAAKAA
jgi:hypothetical protein